MTDKPTGPLTAEQARIDIENLRFYARLFREHTWRTPQLHWNVFESTLNGIADRLASRQSDRPATGRDHDAVETLARQCLIALKEHYGDWIAAQVGYEELIPVIEGWLSVTAAVLPSDGLPSTAPESEARTVSEADALRSSVSAGASIPVKLIHESGETDIVLFCGSDGEELNSLRVGDRTLYFDKEGNYDGWSETF